MSELKIENVPTINPSTSILDNRIKRVDILRKIDDLKINRAKEELEIERRVLENQQIRSKEGGWHHPISKLLEVTNAWVIDNERTVIGSEPALRSLWDSSELELLKELILKKAMSL